jgi:hypothetical protein
MKKEPKADYGMYRRLVSAKVMIPASLILFTLFSLVAMVNSTWIYRTSFPHTYNSGLARVEDQMHYLGSQYHLLEMPDLDGRSRPEVFFHEAPEAYVFEFDFQFYGVDSENYTNTLLQEMDRYEFFKIRGYTTYGLFSLDPIPPPSGSQGDPEPQPWWTYQEWGLEPKLFKQIPDVTNDGYPDIFASFGVVSQKLPELYAFANYSSYFTAKPEEFLFYYNVTQITDSKIIVTSRYDWISNLIINGRTQAKVPGFSFPLESIIDAVVMEGITDGTRAGLVLLKSNYDRMVYLNRDCYFSATNPDLHDFSNTLLGYHLNNGTLGLNLSSSTLATYNFNFIGGIDYYINSDPYEQISRFPLRSMYFDMTMISPNLADSGTMRIQSLGQGLLIEFFDNKYWSDTYTLSFILNWTGNLLWKIEKPLFVSPVDYNGDGFKELGFLEYISPNLSKYVSKNSNLGVNPLSSLLNKTRVIIVDSITGTIKSMFQFPIYNQSTVFYQPQVGGTVAGPAAFKLGFASDSKNPSNTENPDIVGVVQIVRLRTDVDGGEETICYPFRLQLTSLSGQLEIGAYRNVHNLQSFYRLSQHSYLNYLDVYHLPANIDLDTDGLRDYIVSTYSWNHFDDMLLIPSSLRPFESTDQFPINNFLSETEEGGYLDSPYQVYQNQQYSNEFWQERNSIYRIRMNMADRRTIGQKIVVFADPSSQEGRISGFYAQYTGFYFMEDLSQQVQLEPFSDFFFEFSRGLAAGSFIFLGVNALLMILFLFKGKKEAPKKVPKNLQILGTGQRLAGFGLLTTLILIEIFLLAGIRPVVEFTNLYIGPQASLLWFIVIYPAIFPLFAILPPVYSYFASFYAGRLYIGVQRTLYWSRQKIGWLDYDVVVTQMDNRNNMHKVNLIKRMLLPLTIAFTIGVGIYLGLGEGGILTQLIRIFIKGFPAQTNSSVLGIYTPGTPVDDIWAEMGKFARYCVFPMLISYIFAVIIIPGGWLLDDAGVAYLIKEKKYRGINDIEPVSSWLLNIISGVFGTSALLSFISLFLPMFRQLDRLREIMNMRLGDTDLSYLSQYISTGDLAVAVIILALVIYPFLAGASVALACMQRTEEDLIPNTRRLFKWMEKRGFDPRSVDIAEIFDSNVSDIPWPEESSEQAIGTSSTVIVRDPSKL